jgi:adenylate cyclase
VRLPGSSRGREWRTAFRRARRGRRPAILLLLAALLGSGLGVVALQTNLFRRTELDSVDARFSLRPGHHDTRGVVLVLVDDKTFSDFPRLQWPYPRRDQARVLDRIAAGRPQAVAEDIQYTEPTSARDDNALVRAVARAGHVVLSTTETDRHGHTRILGGDAFLKHIGARPGSTLYRADPGDTVRHVAYAYDGLEAFGLVTAEVAQGRAIPRSELPGGRAWIDFRGPAGTFPAYSFSDVLRGTVPPSAFRDKIVVVGASAASLQDLHATSTTGDALVSGPEIQANVVATALDGFPLRSSSHGIDLLLVVLMGLVVPLAALRTGPVKALGVGAALGVAFLVLVQVGFDRGVIFPVTYPLAALILSGLGALAVQGSLAALERARTQVIFGRFVPEPVVEEVLRRADDDLRLGGARREVTVMFSDLRGFTTFAERREPAHVIEILNRYLTEMTDAIMDHGGTLVTYMGDGIMAVFGAPLDQPDHADRALDAAREMTGPRLRRFNAWLREQGGEGFRMGIGLNTGPVMSGNVGSERRMEYTAIGDTTNTAARLEGATKGTPYQVFVAESTRAQLHRPAPDLVRHGELPVRGRSEGVLVWGVEERGPAGHPAETLRDAAPPAQEPTPS